MISKTLSFALLSLALGHCRLRLERRLLLDSQIGNILGAQGLKFSGIDPGKNLPCGDKITLPDKNFPYAASEFC